jgi:hypothetical protein
VELQEDEAVKPLVTDLIRQVINNGNDTCPRDILHDILPGKKAKPQDGITLETTVLCSKFNCPLTPLFNSGNFHNF